MTTTGQTEPIDATEWIRTESRLVAVLTNGSRAALNAKQIWLAAFSDNPRDKEFIVRLQNEGLRFSRFPADPVLIITGNIIQGLLIELAVVCDHDTLNISSNETDQAIYNNCWYAIDYQSIQQSLKHLEAHGITMGSTLSLGLLLWLQSDSNIDIQIIDKTSNTTATQLVADNPFEVITGLHAQLYDYQKTGITFLDLIAKQGIGCILGDEMGLGKTLQVIGLLQKQKNIGRSPFLIVCPATLLENWRRELDLFAPQLHVLFMQATSEPEPSKDY